MILSIIIATFIVSLVSLVGLLTITKSLKNYLHYIISFAAGSLIGVALFDLIPHSLETENAPTAMLFIAFGIILFYLIERFIHWHHCGKEKCRRKSMGVLVMIGDSIHNFIDGLLIAGAFLIDQGTGFATTITALLHEIPQEFGDFSILLHSGYTKAKALWFNFITALTAVIGGIVGYFALKSAEHLIAPTVGIAAGGFLYVALSDIIPDLHKHKSGTPNTTIESIIFVATILLAALVLMH